MDCFAGTGLIGFEALSRGARRVTFIERDRRLVASLKKNIEQLQVAAEVYEGNYFINLINLRRKRQTFDWIYLDPPYFSQQLKPAFEGCLKNKLLKPGGLLITERHQKAEPIPPSVWQGYKLSQVDNRVYGTAALDFYQLADG